VTARTLYADALPLLLSERAAFRLLGIDRCGEAARQLKRSGRLRLVPAGNRMRIPLEDVQRVAREGFTLNEKPVRTRPSRQRGPGVVDPDALRRLDVERLGGTGS
jgi:hypothetical protein